MRATRIGTVCTIGALSALVVGGLTVAHPTTAAAAPVTAAGSVRQAPITLTTSPTYVKGEPFWIHGTAAPGSTFTASIDGTDVGYTVGAGSNGIWSFPSDNGPVGQDSFTLGLRSADASASFTFTADTTPIALTSPSRYVKGHPSRIEGTGPRNTTLQLTTGGLSTTGPRTDADGRWTWDLTADQLRGDSFSMTLSGGGLTKTISLAADPTARPIVLTSPDTYTWGEPFTVTGTATPDAELMVTADGSTGGVPTMADADGRWTYDVPERLTKRNSFSLRVGSALTSATFGFTADSPGPIPIELSGPTTYTSGRSFTVTGTGAPGLAYDVVIDGVPSGETIPLSGGRWSYWVHPSVTRGDRFTLVLRSGEQSESFVFTADSAGPTPIELTGPTTYTQGRSSTVTGTGAPGQAYEVLIDGVPSGETIPGSGGRWSYRVFPSATERDRFTLTLRSGAQSTSFVFTAA